MTICSRLIVVQNLAEKLPDSRQKDVLLEQMQELLFYADKHDEGDKAVSDQFHKMCNDCQRLTIENRMLKLENERLKQ